MHINPQNWTDKDKLAVLFNPDFGMCNHCIYRDGALAMFSWNCKLDIIAYGEKRAYQLEKEVDQLCHNWKRK